MALAGEFPDSKVVTMSDSSGFIHVPEGLTTEKLEIIKEVKNVRCGRIRDVVADIGATFHAAKTRWPVPCELAFLCATQNEMDYIRGANLAGFRRVADAMLAYGII